MVITSIATGNKQYVLCMLFVIACLLFVVIVSVLVKNITHKKPTITTIKDTVQNTLNTLHSHKGNFCLLQVFCRLQFLADLQTVHKERREGKKKDNQRDNRRA